MIDVRERRKPMTTGKRLKIEMMTMAVGDWLKGESRLQ